MTTTELSGYRSRLSNPAADPLFWVSLGYADLLLERWMANNCDSNGELDLSLLPSQAVTGVNAAEYVPGLTPLTSNAEMFVLSTTLGYTYDWFLQDS